MTQLFLALLNRSLAASWLVLAILLLRLILRNIPKWANCLLWGLVGVRLICPFTIESVFSLVPSGETVPQEIVYTQTPAIHSGIGALNSVVNPILSDNLSPVEYFSVTPMQVVVFAVSVIWLIGVAIMGIYTLGSWLHLRRKVRVAMELEEGVWLCDDIDTPFILGVLRPRIYLPSALEEGARPHVLAHERAHLKRRDHWWKPLGFALLALNWFNPLMWAAYVLLCRDIELACDEKVIRNLGGEEKKGYSLALLQCSVSRPSVAACPLAFGEVGVKQRIKAVVNYKKPAFWVIVVAVILCVVAGICFLTDPIGGVQGELEEALHQAILAEDGDPEKGGVRFEAHTVLGTQKRGDEITVYAMVLEQEYAYANGKSEKMSGSHGPKAFTFVKTETGYELVEEWWPRDGAYYTPSIREKFPWYLWLRVDTQDYIDGHQADCQAQAEEYFSRYGGSTPVAGEWETTPYYDSIDYDVDGDGVAERCVLGYGSTSGLFTFTFNVYEQGALEYSSIFNTKWYDLSFHLDEQGKLWVRGIPQDDSGERLFEVTMQEGYVALLEGDTALPMWGEVLRALDYEYYTSDEGNESLMGNPRLIFNREEQTYSFSYSLVSSYLDFGTYELEAGLLRLHTKDGKFYYFFHRQGDELVYRADLSHPYPMMDLPDGAVFYPLRDENAPISSSIWFDIDGDGIEEYCTLREGTDTDLTRHIRIYERGVLEYSGIAEGTAFTVVDGELRIDRSGITEWYGDALGWYTITLQGDEVVLTLQGVA